jgi:PAS domain S-box-containing protein
MQEAGRARTRGSNSAKTETSTILIIDDEPALRAALGDLLAVEGYDLTLASSGLEGLKKAAELIPDLVLLDVKMPDIDGFEVCRRLRADPLLSDVPVIMVTSLVDRDSRLRGFEAGADDFVSKPVDDYELLARVRTTTRLNRFRRLLLEQTRRQQAEEALRESEARYRGLFEGMPVGLYRSTPEGRILDANPAMVEMLGYPEREALLAVNVIDTFLNPGERQRWVALMERNGLVRDFETQVRRRDGRVIWVKDTARVIRDSQGQTDYYEGSLEEITERKQAEEALRRERDFAESLIKTAQTIVLILDPQGQIVRFNPYMEEISGYRLEEVQGKDWFTTFLPERDRGRIQELFLRAVSDIQTRGNVNSIVTKDGRERDIAWYDKTLKDADGNVAGVLAVGQDITERIRAEEALKHRNEELAALHAIASAASRSLSLDEMLNAALGETMAVLDVEAGMICLLDEASRALAPVVHRGFSQTMLEEAASFDIGEGLPGRVAETGQPVSVCNLAEDSGNVAPVLVQEGWGSLVSAPLKAQDKTVGVITLIAQDRYHFSPEDVDLLSAIGPQVGVAVDNTRLAKEAAEAEILQELDRLRSELIANVSHELRTPLGLIKVFCTTLLREDVEFDRETQREFLQDIDEETERLEKIVDDLLDLSRMESGRLRLDKRPTDVSQLIRGVMEAMGTSIQPVQHRLAHDLPGDRLVATVDPKHIEQVLRNLLGNAIKYSPQGGTITVGGRGDERQILIWVSDEGIGIPAPDLERIFERFYRVENEVTMNVRGAGLGLSVCRGIVEAHGGRIWAESIPGEGSTFYFALPNDGERENARRKDPHSGSR